MTILGIFIHHFPVICQGFRWLCHFAIVRNGQYGKHKSAGRLIWTAESRRMAGRGKDAEHQKCDFAFLTESIAYTITSGGTSLCRSEPLNITEVP